MKLLLILGDQLFPIEFYSPYKDHLVFMKEDLGLCTHFKYHKHKIIFFLASMRRFYHGLVEQGFNAHYSQLNELSFTKDLLGFVEKNKIKEITVPEIQDKFFEKIITDFCIDHDLVLKVIPGPMFLSSRENFQLYLKSHKKPFMKTFYEGERKRLKVMIDDEIPWGGKWSYDEENRKKAPKEINLPPRPRFEFSSDVEEVKKLVETQFNDHPGKSQSFWLPTKREDALQILEHFLENYLHSFGDYQDSITNKHPFMYHSIISPMMNNGMLTPQEIIDKAIAYYQKNKKKIPLNSLEGFIRQIMGWREFVRGIYQNYSEKQDELNFFNHQRKLTTHWYKGSLGIPPVDDAIIKANQFGYCHHIERLMVLSNFMLLCEVHPQDVHRWFMEMFVDSADWVMGPNVYGMGQFSDGGIFATKPYISGSNYILKMSDYKKGDWSEIWDGLFWRFIDKNRTFMKKQHRLGFMVMTFDKMDVKKRETLLRLAEDFIQAKTR